MNRGHDNIQYLFHEEIPEEGVNKLRRSGVVPPLDSFTTDIGGKEATVGGKTGFGTNLLRNCIKLIGEERADY